MCDQFAECPGSSLKLVSVPMEYVCSTHLRVENPRVVLQVPRRVRQRASSLVHHWLVPEGEVRPG